MIGIIGGIGPLATVYFMELVINKTDATKDQDHIDMIVFNHATIPDRTKFILGQSQDDPTIKMIEDAKKLETLGVSHIVIPCNTAHYFFDQIQQAVSIPVINIIEETVHSLTKNNNIKKVGILATDGTINTHSYQKVCDHYGLSYEIPNPKHQAALMDIIYNQVKTGDKAINIELLQSIIDDLSNNGCNAIILGCTELSVINANYRLTHNLIVDSLEALAEKTIVLAGKKIK